jgi:hypothetical protein
VGPKKSSSIPLLTPLWGKNRDQWGCTDRIPPPYTVCCLWEGSRTCAGLQWGALWGDLCQEMANAPLPLSAHPCTCFPDLPIGMRRWAARRPQGHGVKGGHRRSFFRRSPLSVTAAAGGDPPTAPGTGRLPPAPSSQLGGGKRRLPPAACSAVSLLNPSMVSHGFARILGIHTPTIWY